MKIQRTDHDELNLSLNITVEKSDYEPKFLSELKNYKNKAQLKGFRKGKTPSGFIKKMYGQSILAETVNGALQDSLFNYIKDNDLNVLGDPLPALDQEQLELDPMTLEDYSFKFDVGVSPNFEVTGASASDSYNIYKVAVDNKVLEEELSVARKRQGTQVEIEKDIEEKDILTLEAKELDGKKIKEGGWETSFTIMVDLIEEDKLKKDVLSKKLGDNFDFDIYKIEKDRDEAHVKKYFLNLDPEEEKEIGAQFQAKITKVQRLKEADLDQAFFDGYFGPDVVKTEAEAKDKIKESIGGYYDNQAMSFMYREMLESMVAQNDIALPEAFLKRWLKSTNEGLEDEQLDKEFPDFIKNLKWTLIRGELAKAENIEVKPEEIQEHMSAQVRQYFGNYGMDNEYIQSTIQKMMSDRNQVNKTYEELLSNKVFDVIGKKIVQNEQSITLDDFKEKVKETNERLKA